MAVDERIFDGGRAAEADSLLSLALCGITVRDHRHSADFSGILLSGGWR